MTTSGSTGRAPQSSTRAVDRALSLLGHVITAGSPPTLAEASRFAGLPVSTAARLLTTLERHKLVRRSGDGRYWPGMRMFELSSAALRGLSVYELAGEHLEALLSATGESSYLLVPVGRHRAVYLRQAQSEASIRHASWLGRTIPLAGSATGAALAGATNEAGYAVNRGAIEPDTATAAAPVYASDGEIVAAMSVIAPSFRVDDRRLSDMGRLVAERARSLSGELGSALPSPDAAVEGGAGLPLAGMSTRTAER